jgi:hypothetical protein
MLVDSKFVCIIAAFYTRNSFFHQSFTLLKTQVFSEDAIRINNMKYETYVVLCPVLKSSKVSFVL